MSDEQISAQAPIDAEDEAVRNERIAAAQQMASELMALDVPEISQYLPELDLYTLRFALLAEESKGDAARADAIAAINAAIDAHPEQVTAVAAGAEPVNEGAPAPAVDPTPETAPADPDPAMAAQADEPDVAPDEAPAEEVNLGPSNEELADGNVLMTHPEGGSSDAFDHNEAGHCIVPFAAVETMLSHGFTVIAHLAE